MPSKWIEIVTADGRMHAYLGEPAGAGPYPAVVVCMEAFGVNAYLRSVVDRLADAGFVAVAPELYHRTGTHYELAYDEGRERVMAALGLVTNATLEEDVGATLAWLRARSDVAPARLATIGFCMGGFAALLGGVTTAVAAVVAFYPGGLVHVRPQFKLEPFVERLATMRAATLLHFGGDDGAIPPADVAAVKAALERSPSQHEVIVWPGAKHGFHTHDRTPAYDPHTAEQAWHRTLAWLETMLRSAP